METAVVEHGTLKEQWYRPVIPVEKPEKKSFEKASVECNAIPLEIFIDELKKRVKERYQNAKG